MSQLDIIDAKKALKARLELWGVEVDARGKADGFIDDLVARGWAMAAYRETRPHPPKASEECPRHPGQPIARCGGCHADRRAATYDDETEGERMDRETALQAARAALRSTSSEEGEG